MQFNTLHSNIPWTKYSTLLYDIWCAKHAKQYRNTVASPQFAPKWIMCAREENQACWCIDAYWSQSGMPAVREVVRMGCFHAHRTHYGPRSQVLFRAWTALGLRYAAGMYLHGWEHCESDVSLCQWWRQHRGLKQDVENGDRSWQSGILCIIQSWLCQSKRYHLNVL